MEDKQYADILEAVEGLGLLDLQKLLDELEPLRTKLLNENAFHAFHDLYYTLEAEEKEKHVN